MGVRRLLLPFMSVFYGVSKYGSTPANVENERGDHHRLQDSWRLIAEFIHANSKEPAS